MTVPVPESIRATAIEAATGYISVPYGRSLTRTLIGRSEATAIVDAVLPAVVAQVQADALEAARQVIAGEDMVVWARAAQRSTIRLDLAMKWLDDLEAVYREKGENNG